MVFKIIVSEYALHSNKIYIDTYFWKIMDEEVEKELSNLVKILIETVPSLNSVRLFGSYLNGKWNPKTSDIDILVCINDEHYSVYKDRTKDWDDITGYFSIIGSEQRRNLRENIENKEIA